jgi:hypothetical protein
MKTRLWNLLWKTAVVLIIVGAICAEFISRPDTDAQKAVVATRQMLRDQGFKTDVADFDFSSPTELRAREAILTNAIASRNPNPFVNHPNLMETVGDDSAIVVWKQDSLKKEYPSWPDNNDKLTWEEFREAINTNQAQVDAACAAILSGPIGFNLDARGGNAVRLPHLAMMKNLTQTLDSRIMLDLHDGNLDAAWTNLMAATRLVTTWEPETTEISQLVRFGNAKLTFNAIWQGLQTNGWTDEQLARLQQEWDTVDFFKHLTETAAFKRASAVLACEQERHPPADERMPIAEFLKEMFQHPLDACSVLQYEWKHACYLKKGSYKDETNLLLFYRDREVELRNAVQATNWSQMRQLPGVTNKALFQSKYRSRIQAMLNVREMGTAFLKDRSGLLGRATEAEVRRRILITAIALERYRGKHGAYSQTLAELAPEFLKTVPMDFMDGQPLRYRLTDDGHFMLYSVGLDCVDDGGIIQTREQRIRANREAGLMGIRPEADIVWPLPATAAAVEALRLQEARAKELQSQYQLEQESEMEWDISPSRQSRVGKILATNWLHDAENLSYQGRPLNDVIRNENVTGTNRLSLAQLMTPRQIITGDEPEDLTFELPVSYDVITNLGALVLLVDAEMDIPMIPDRGARIQDCKRATNGDCLLVWHAIYDPPGRHAVQVQLIHTDWRQAEYFDKSPAIPVVTSNLCQFSLDSATYDVERGATFHARLPESNGRYTIECLTTNGEHLATLTGSTTNGEFKTVWNLVDDHGHRLNGETFNSIVRLTLPDSGRTQTLKGP